MADARLARTARSDANARALRASESRISASAMSSVHERDRTSSAGLSLLRVPEGERRGLRVRARGPSHERQIRKARVHRLVYERRRRVRWARLQRAWQRADPCRIPTRVGSRQQVERAAPLPWLVTLRFARPSGFEPLTWSCSLRRASLHGRSCSRLWRCARRRVQRPGLAEPSLLAGLSACEESRLARSRLGLVVGSSHARGRRRRASPGSIRRGMSGAVTAPARGVTSAMISAADQWIRTTDLRLRRPSLSERFSREKRTF